MFESRVWWRRSVFGVVCLAVGVAGLPVTSASAADGETEQGSAAAESTSTPGVRPDAMSAMVTARVTGQRVEDLSQRDETTQVFANPDGSWTSSIATEPERVQDPASGEWVPIDTTLVESEGRVAPGQAAADVSFSAGGDRVFASLTEAGKTIEWRWPTVLPQPRIEGNSATYVDAVQGGGDLVVTASSTGFSHEVILQEPPTGPVQLPIPIAADGAQVTQAPGSGAIEVATAGGQTLAAAPQPLMWDSSEDAAGEPVVEELATQLDERPSGVDVMTLAPDQEFLADPATEYPVTIDPSFTTYVTGDAWVQNAGYTSGQVSSDHLRAGTYDGGAHKARSFMRFDSQTAKSTWTGKQIVSAELVMRNFSSTSCEGADIRVHPISQAWNSPDLTWANQPDVNTNFGVDYRPAHGGGSACPEAYAEWNITPIVQAWADRSIPNQGLRLRAPNESNSATWRKYWSANVGSDKPVQYKPRIRVTHNTIPSTASAPTVAPAATFNSSTYTSSTTPTLRSKATDGDGSSLSMSFEVHNSTAGTATTRVATCTVDSVASGSLAECAPAAGLSDGTYYVRARARDSLVAGPWSGWTKFIVAAGTPAPPTINCTGQARGEWSTQVPSSPVSCRITATGSGPSAPGYIKYAVDGAPAQLKQIPQSSDPSVAGVSVTVPNTEGGHQITAWAQTPSGKLSSVADYAFGFGEVGIDQPAAGDMPTVTNSLTVAASGPAGATTAELQWRLAASEEATSSGWNVAQSLPVDPDPTTGGVLAEGRLDLTELLRDEAAGIELDPRTTAILDVQVCFDYAAGQRCTAAADPRRVMRVPHAFGSGFPVEEAGPGEVALWTGEFTTGITDVTVPGYTGDLSLGRSYATFTGQDDGPFGPGWVPAFDGPEAGIAGYELFDNTTIDGTLVLADPAGAPLVFRPSTDWKRRTATTFTPGAWVAADDETRLSGLTATITGIGTATEVRITDPDSVVTTFRVTEAPAATAPSEFAPYSVAEPGLTSATTYGRDGQGRITRMLAPLPPGLSTDACSTTGTLTRGCRALDIVYAGSTTATSSTPGDITGQVKRVDLRIFNPETNTMQATPVATYTYRSDGRLVSVTDPRTNLSTTYSYDSSGRLSRVGEPGLEPYQLEYGSDGKLARVKRTRPAASGGGTATLTTVLYNIGTSGEGRPDLSAETVRTGWGQDNPPTYAAAVFGADRPVSTLDPTGLTAEDWNYATVYATDARGYEVNTATYGAGKWLPTWTAYDTNGNPTRILEAGDIDAVRTGEAIATQVGTTNVYNTDTNGPAQTPAGSVPTDAYGPARWVTLDNGDTAHARPHERYTYDQGAPNGGINPDTNQGWALPTETRTRPVTPDTLEPLEPAKITTTGYGDTTASWKLGLPTVETIHMDGTSTISYRTQYDDAGRVTATLQPKSNGTDAGTRRTAYYSAQTATRAECSNKPEWAGLECVTDYAGPTAAGGQNLITTRTEAYNQYLQPTKVVETANGATRVATNTYDQATRPTLTRTATTGLTGSTPIKGTATVYNASTGLPTEQWNTDTTGTKTGTPIIIGYDSWGRETTYQTGPGETTTTTYDNAGRLTTITDPKGTRTYGYGPDARGNTERRGLPTSLTITGAPGGGNLQYNAAYNADETLTLQRLPGGLTQSTEVDAAGEPSSLTYSGPTSNGDAAWLGWSTENDIDGRVRREWTPSGPAFADTATRYDRAYTYDNAGRLTQVQDRATEPATGEPSCETRAYTYDPNGNRTSLTRTPGDQNTGNCSTPGAAGTTAKNWSHDAGDRINTPGYTYDALGRATTIPADDTPNQGPQINIGYHDDDSVASITQGTTTSTYTRDPAGRRRVEATGPVGQSPTSVTTRHYQDGTDNPSWTSTNDSSGVTTTRYIEDLNGDFGLSLTTWSSTSATSLSLSDAHGDAVATVAVENATATGISEWTDHDEFGNSSTPNIGGAKTEAIDYSWLGSKQRARTEPGALILMGARLYNSQTAQFTSPDPVFGANTTSYTYPQDPVNLADISGERPCHICLPGGGGFGLPGLKFKIRLGRPKLGQVHADGPSRITRLRRHAVEQAIGRDGGRGVKAWAVRSALKNPAKVKRTWRDDRGFSYVYSNRNAMVVVNQRGHIVTVIAKRRKAVRNPK